jgi:pantoate--beta-alanine ligase
MEKIRIPKIMRQTSAGYLLKGKSIGFVPTMGALHEGHLSLVRTAKSENDITVVSIFVNPIQFGKNEDFDKYPRDMDGDMEKLIKEGVDILFIPDAKAIYPENFATCVMVDGISDKLCGSFRPGHFAGVATVVCKLFNIVMPVRAYFGQKDYQQTLVIRRLVEDLNMGVDVIVCRTAREADGLAMSSRNVYLSPEERSAAGIIYKTLLSASQLLKSGASSPEDVKKYMHDALKAEPLVSEIQYAGVYNADTLEEIVDIQKRKLLAAAVKIGGTRLIDNVVVNAF